MQRDVRDLARISALDALPRLMALTAGLGRRSKLFARPMRSIPRHIVTPWYFDPGRFGPLKRSIPQRLSAWAGPGCSSEYWISTSRSVRRAAAP